MSVTPPEPETEDGDLLLRSRRRLPVRRSLLPRSRAGWILFASAILLAMAAAWIAFAATRHFFQHDARFRIDSASSIQIVGNSQLSRGELLAIFGGDIGRNIFFVPLPMRRTELESLPWVEHATVMRLLPDQLRIAVTERTPVAFVRKGNHIELIDHDGVLLTMPSAMLAAKHYSFPVITGVAASQDPELRADRMHAYEAFIKALGEAGAKSETLSEVDLSDPEDIRAVLPIAGSDILVHFGDSDFANRYRTFQTHLADWQHAYPRLAAVDLRYEHQTVLEMAKGAEDMQDGSTDTGTPAENTHNTATPVARSRTASPTIARNAAAHHAGTAKTARHISHTAARHAASHVSAKSPGKKGKPAGRG